MEIVVAAADLWVIVVVIVAVVAVAVVIAAAAVVASAAVVAAVAAAAAEVVGAPLVAAAAPAGLIAVDLMPLKSGATEEMKPIAAAKEPAIASGAVEDGGVRLDQKLLTFASTTAAVTKRFAS